MLGAHRTHSSSTSASFATIERLEAAHEEKVERATSSVASQSPAQGETCAFTLRLRIRPGIKRNRSQTRAQCPHGTCKELLLLLSSCRVLVVTRNAAPKHHPNIALHNQAHLQYHGDDRIWSACMYPSIRHVKTTRQPHPRPRLALRSSK